MTSVRADYHNKYRIVGNMLQAAEGKLLDIGARDAVLKQYLPAALGYQSADFAPGCDLMIDLEKPLGFADVAFDYVIALDVLEHIENPHAAFAELQRIAGKGIILALPCMASLPRRVRFLWDGTLGTDKYSLCAEHQGDRHRWLTIYPEVLDFYQAMATKHHLKLVDVVAQLGPSPFWALSGLPFARMGIGTGLFTDRLLARFERA